MNVTESDREWLVKMHTQGVGARTLKEALVAQQSMTNVPFSGRFRPQKRKSRRAVPGIKPGPAVVLDDSISVWLSEDRYRSFMIERGRRMPTVEEQVSQEVSINVKTNFRTEEGVSDNE